MTDFYVDTDNAAGGRDGSESDPWDSLFEFVDNDLATIGTGIHNVFLRGTAIDSDSVIIDFSVTGNLTINFIPWTGADDGRYTGKDNWSTSHYRFDSGDTTPVASMIIRGDDETSDVRELNFVNLQFGHNSTSSSKRVIEIESGASGDINFLGSRLRHTGTGTFPRICRFDGGVTSAVNLTYKNCLLLYGGSQLMSAFNINDSLATTDIYNCTVVYSNASGGEDGIDDVASCVTDARNNVFYAEAGGTAIEFDIAGTITKDYNAHTNSADRGANGFAVAQADFTSFGTADGDDLSPAASQTNAWGAGGLTQGSLADIPDDDITGAARNTGAGQNTAIGCFAAAGEGPSAGGPVTQVYHARHHNRAL